MYMRRTEAARCLRCGSPIRYGVKAEPAVWKVHAECTDGRCPHEFSPGRIPRAEIAHIDQVYERAERLLARLR